MSALYIVWTGEACQGPLPHKTESIYRRYAIVDEAMLREAAARLDAVTSAPPPSGNTTGTVATFTPTAAKVRRRTGSERDQSGVSVDGEDR